MITDNTWYETFAVMYWSPNPETSDLLSTPMYICVTSFPQIKFLKSKEGSAMIQLGDPIAVERAIANLNNAHVFGNKLQLR